MLSNLFGGYNQFLTGVLGSKVTKDVTYERLLLRGCTISSHDILSVCICTYVYHSLKYNSREFLAKEKYTKKITFLPFTDEIYFSLLAILSTCNIIDFFSLTHSFHPCAHSKCKFYADSFNMRGKREEIIKG